MALINHDEEHIYETIKLQQDQEYRIYLKKNEWVRLWMVHGSAEVFGTELREAKRNERYGQSYAHRRQPSKKRHKSNKMSIDEITSNPNDKEEMYHVRDSYLFSSSNVSIYTYQGATLYIKFLKDTCEDRFCIKETAYNVYCNYNAALTNMRRSAEVHQTRMILENKLSAKPTLPKIAADVISNDFSLNEHKILDLEQMKEITTYGPRVLVLGPANCGKASLCKILGNYALRSGYYPILVDLDCSLNMISIPGTIAALSVTEPIDVENGFNHSHAMSVRKKKADKNKNKEDEHKLDTHLDDLMDGEDGIKEQQELNPIIYFYGDVKPDRHLKVYEKCVEKLSLSVKKKLFLNLEARASGIIVKCHGCCNDPNNNMKGLISNIIKLFHIDTVLVIDDELTLNYLKNKYRDNINPHNYYNLLSSNKNKIDLSSYWKQRFIAIEKAVKSGGVRVRGQPERLAIGRNIIRNYFYGNNNNFRPLSCETYPKFLRVYKIGSSHTVNDLLPADQRSVVGSFEVLKVRMDSSLRGQILAVLQIDNGINEKEQYQIERDINAMTANNEYSAQIFDHLIEHDQDNLDILYNRSSGAQISVDPFGGDSKLKNKLIRSSNVMGFVHVQEIKYDPHNRQQIQKLTLLNPCQNKLPLKCLLKGHINWHDR